MVHGMNVFSYARLHVGLIDLGGVTPRRHGGAGVTISEPYFQICIRRSDRKGIDIDGARVLDEGAKQSLLEASKRIEVILKYCKVRVEVKNAIPPHMGFGSKTALLMAFITGIFKFEGTHISKSEIIGLSGRGGVSGVGINAFFKGGFLIDSGHSRHPSESFMPSSYCQDFTPPKTSVNLPIPRRWSFILIRPESRQFSGRSELKVFKRHCPISKNDVLETMAAIYHGVCPAFQYNDLDLLHLSLKNISKCGFKRHEIDAHTPSVRGLLETLQYDLGIAAGLSSMGPTIFAIVDSSELHRRQMEILNVVERFRATVLTTAKGRNDGYRITH
jgi:beta-ribofuranosylaminobenzene 5'-phosphate synthase